MRTGFLPTAGRGCLMYSHNNRQGYAQRTSIIANGADLASALGSGAAAASMMLMAWPDPKPAPATVVPISSGWPLEINRQLSSGTTAQRQTAPATRPTVCTGWVLTIAGPASCDPSSRKSVHVSSTSGMIFSGRKCDAHGQPRERDSGDDSGTTAVWVGARASMEGAVPQWDSPRRRLARRLRPPSQECCLYNRLPALLWRR